MGFGVESSGPEAFLLGSSLITLTLSVSLPYFLSLCQVEIIYLNFLSLISRFDKLYFPEMLSFSSKFWNLFAQNCVKYSHNILNPSVSIVVLSLFSILLPSVLILDLQKCI